MGGKITRSLELKKIVFNNKIFIWDISVYLLILTYRKGQPVYLLLNRANVSFIQ